MGKAQVIDLLAVKAIQAERSKATESEFAEARRIYKISENVRLFQDLIESCWDRSTCDDRLQNAWSPQLPGLGHDDVTSLLAFYILRARAVPIEIVRWEVEAYGWYYANRIETYVYDFTRTLLPISRNPEPIGSDLTRLFVDQKKYIIICHRFASAIFNRLIEPPIPDR